MGERGFSLVEMLVVVAIIGVLLAVATLQFSSYTQKANIESQVRTMYADVMEARSQALLQKTGRSFGTTATLFTVYNGAGAPIVQKTLTYPVSFDFSDKITFDTRGVADGTKTICVGPAGNAANIDSISLTETMIQLGKRNGGACDSAHFTAK
jgi:type IV fimbrial biogenesis protein FimT